MGRSALTVGISTYSYQGLKNLEAPALDAEAIAQQLESSFSPFRVERLPGIKDKANDGLKTGKTSQVTLRQLQEALVRYFNPRGETYSDTVLFYFSGHGLYDDLTGKSYLATSDTNPEDNKWGYPLTDLSTLLRDSPVKRQIIWLDCCHSGGLIAVKDANPGEQSGYSRCFVAASQEIESAYELTSGSYGVLTDGLLQGLNPERVPGQWIDTLSLCAFVNQYLKIIRKTYPQRSLFLNVGEPIELTYATTGSTPVGGLNELQVDICPYRALNAFDFTPEDVEVFFGRTALTDELLAQICEHNFLAVLGPSGSGKSSVVRAGLLYELQQGKRRSGTETWHILPIMRPGESPLRNLAGVFIPEELRTKKSGETLLSSSLSDLKSRGAEALVDLISEDYEQPVVLVVDQFEEIFTLCRGSQEKEQERKDFLDCLFGAVDTLAGQLRLVITLRADFLGKCLEQSYGNLAGRIKDYRVDITPLTDSELDEVINKPAATVGLQVAPYLQDRLKDHIKEAPGSLPLLEYALTELWRDWHTCYTSGDADVGNQLTFEGYDRIGGVAGALEKQANAVYESFAESTIKQGLVQRIFLELVQPGEETEDTRRQILKRELISEVHPEAMLDEVLGKLVEARLVVTDEVPTENDPNAVVIELAHEATIRHWQQLRYWLNKHRQDLPVIRQLRADASTWQINNQQSKYLLVGARLDAALECVKKYQQLGYLNEVVQTFVKVSWKTWIAEETEKEQQVLESLCLLAEVQWKQYQQLESLLSITQAGKRLQEILRTRPEIKPQNSQKVISKLQQTLYTRIQEKNRLEVSSDPVKALVYSPDGKTLCVIQGNTLLLWHTMNDSHSSSLEVNSKGSADLTLSPNGKILAFSSGNETKLWNTMDGSLIAQMDRTSGSMNSSLKGDGKGNPLMAFSFDSKTFASWNGDKVNLWNQINGYLVMKLEDHSKSINALDLSPDGNILASAGEDKTVKLWDATNGSIIVNLEGHDRGVNGVVFSSIGKILASVSRNIIKLWNIDGSLIANLEGHSEEVRGLIFSPDGKVLASASRDVVKLWNVDGSLLANLEGHSRGLKRVVFSFDGKTIASTSEEPTIKLWNTTDGSLIANLNHDGKVNSMVYSPDGKTIATSSDDATVRIWSVTDGTLISSLRGHSESVTDVVFSPDGRTLASASNDKTVRFWSIADDNSAHSSLEGHSESVSSIAFSSDGKTLASASWDKTIKFWKLIDNSIIYNLEDRDYVEVVVYSPDGRIVASAGCDDIVKLWNSVDGSLIFNLEGHTTRVIDVIFSTDCNVLASASEDKTIKLWNVTNGSLISSLECRYAPRALSFSPNSKILASASQLGTVQLWNIEENCTLLTNLEGHKGWVSAFAFSPDGKICASASKNTVKLWNALDNSLIFNLEEHIGSVNAIVFSPDGKILASASNDKIQLWNVTNGTLISRLEGHIDPVKTLAYSPDGTILASTAGDTIMIWNGRDGAPIHTLKGHTSYINSLAFSPDGTILASASNDKTIKLWSLDFDLGLDALMTQACNWLHDYLSYNPNVSMSDKKLLERFSESTFKQA